MTYLIAFLEGIVTFISPCLLPMLPVYISYFAADGDKPSGGALRNAFGFVLGFTAVFVSLGVFAGSLGALLNAHKGAVNVVMGLVMVLFGLSYLGVLPELFRGSAQASVRPAGFLRAAVFGAVFSVSWTPCVSVFLGSALMLAANASSAGAGALMLLCYALGLGIPFLLSALLIHQLKGAFAFIKRHYAAVRLVSGTLLIAVGVLMMTGLLDSLLLTLRP